MPSFALRTLALLAMCLDHAGLSLFPGVPLFRCIGRIAFPLYCFLLTEGFIHTKDVRAYAGRLLLLALVSEIPFDLLIFGRIACGAEQNVVFSLLLSLLALIALSQSPPRRALPAVCVMMLLGMAARVSYGWLGIALCAAFYFARGSRVLCALCACALPLFYSATLLFSGVDRAWVMLSLWACAAALPILLYNGRRGLTFPGFAALSYASYPLHIAALVLIRALRIIPPYFFL